MSIKIAPVGSYNGSKPLKDTFLDGRNNVKKDSVDTQHPQQVDIKEISVHLDNDTISKINKILTPHQRSLQFSADSETGKLIIQVIDMTTNKVVYQITGGLGIGVSDDLDKLVGMIVDKII